MSASPNDQLPAVRDILESEVVKNLLAPPAKEIGEFLGTIAHITRFYATKNLEDIFKKWARSRGGRAPSEEEVKRAMPLIPSASMVSDEELQERWATLLESTAIETGSLLSFGQTLSQLNAEQVRYLDHLWNKVAQMAIPLPFAYYELVRVFDHEINQGMNATEFAVFRDRMTPQQKANYERLEHARLVVADVIRLGIISEKITQRPHEYILKEDQVVLADSKPPQFEARYSFSEYGSSFMKAVTRNSTG